MRNRKPQTPSAQDQLTDAIKAWRTSSQTMADFNPVMFAIARAFRQIDGTMISLAVAKGFETTIECEYVSVWDGGMEITTKCRFNPTTFEIEEIETADVEGLEICEKEFMRLPNGECFECKCGEITSPGWATPKSF